MSDLCIKGYNNILKVTKRLAPCNKLLKPNNTYVINRFMNFFGLLFERNSSVLSVVFRILNTAFIPS